MQITNIEVTVSRKRQPAQYEEGHVGVKLNAIVDQGESYTAILGTLLDTAQHFVSKRVGLPNEGAPVFGGTIATATVTAADGTKATVTAEPVAPKAEKPKKGEKTAAERGQIATNPENRVQPSSEIPTATVAPVAATPEIPTATVAATPAPAAVTSEIPAAVAPPTPTAGTDEVTAEALSAYISSQARSKQQGGKGFTVPEVKALQKTFGVERLADLKPEQRGPFKLSLEKIVA
jgi:hypothetical protein